MNKQTNNIDVNQAEDSMGVYAKAKIAVQAQIFNIHVCAFDR